MSRPNLVTEMKALLGEADAEEADAAAKTKKLMAALADEAYDRAAKWQLLKFGIQKLSVEPKGKGLHFKAIAENGPPLLFVAIVEFSPKKGHFYRLIDSANNVVDLPLDTSPAEVIKRLWTMQLKLLKAPAAKKEDLDEPLEEEEETPVATLTPDGKLPEGDVSPEDKRAALDVFNAKLAKLMQGLKKGADAETIRMNYKGTGKQAFRRQLWVRFKNGAVIDLWLDNGFLKFGGVVNRNNSGGQTVPAPVIYKDKTPEDVFDVALKALKTWAG
jgi:hypothetical protein